MSSAWAQNQPGSLPRAQAPIRIEVLPGPLEVFSDGRELLFPDVQLTGEEQWVRGRQGPTLTIVDASGSSQGWRVFLQSSDFLGPSQERLPAEGFTFQAQGGNLAALEADTRQNLPLESNLNHSLRTPTLAVLAPLGTGSGSFQWKPSPAAFQLKIPASARPGRYQAQVTVTLIRGNP